MFRILFKLLSICAFLIIPVLSNSALLDPNIPDGEKITYASTTEGKSTTIVEETCVKTEGSRKVYEITSISGSEDRDIKIEKETMKVLSVHTFRKHPEGTVDSKQTFTEKKSVREDEIRLVDFVVLRYLLRGFPFGKVNNMKVVGFGEGRQSNFAIKVKFLKEEKVKVSGGTFNCYKLEIAIEGFLAAFFPKTSLWYSVEEPHYLVRCEEPSHTGSSKRIIELVKYEKY